MHSFFHFHNYIIILFLYPRIFFQINILYVLRMQAYLTYVCFIYFQGNTEIRNVLTKGLFAQN